MPRVDGILKIVSQQRASELRIRAGRPAELTRDGEPLTFTLPPMSDEMLRELIDDLLTDDQRESLDAGREVVFSYGSRGLGTFWFKLNRPHDELELTGWPAEPDVGRSAPTSEEIWADPEPEQPPTALPMIQGAPVASPVLPQARAAPVEQPAPARLVPSGPAPRPSPALAALMYRAAQAGASDLHLADGEAPTLRIGGRLRSLGDEPIDVLALLGELLDSAQRTRLAGGSVDFSCEVDDVGRFRVNVYRHAAGFAAALRVLARHPPSLASLGLPPQLRDLADLNHGLVILCGPTGSGKSTTLAAMVQQRVRERPTLLVTLEEPLEYTIVGHNGSLVRQREVGQHVASYADGLRDALREDPDVLLIGEMRDAESIAQALTAAETGHLVLTSLHSRTAPSAIERIVDTYPPERQQQIRVQLADSLRAIVGQRLLPRADGGGRVAAVEIMVANHAVANLIREGKTAQLASVIQSGNKEGMRSMERSLAEMVRGGLLRSETARGAANDPASFRSYLR